MLSFWPVSRIVVFVLRIASVITVIRFAVPYLNFSLAVRCGCRLDFERFRLLFSRFSSFCLFRIRMLVTSFRGSPRWVPCVFSLRFSLVCLLPDHPSLDFTFCNCLAFLSMSIMSSPIDLPSIYVFRHTYPVFFICIFFISLFSFFSPYCRCGLIAFSGLFAHIVLGSFIFPTPVHISSKVRPHRHLHVSVPCASFRSNSSPSTPRSCVS